MPASPSAAEASCRAPRHSRASASYVIATLAIALLSASGAYVARAQNPPVTSPRTTPQTVQPRRTGEAWRIIQPAQASLVLARDGSLVGEIGRELRTSVSVRTLPRYVGQAFIAVEDKRFYQHDGVDVIGFAGALKDAVRGEARGASTITQLLVGNMHPDVIDRSDRTLGRKLREQQAAREMEKRYSKEQILEAFLNQIHFGHGWYGVESAARHYFGKPAAQLTLAEAASLAALPKGPAIYDPIRAPERNRGRRDIVLALMAEQKYITRAQSDAARREPVVTAPNGGLAAPAPYFVDAVRREAERDGIALASGGLRIHTTLDPALQASAVDALAKGVAVVEARPDFKHGTYAARAKGQTEYLQGMIVALDPANGEVLALVGGRDYAESQFNRAVNATRQPGSTFKPIVYAAGVSAFIPPNEIIPDTALAIPLEGGRVYRPQNSDRAFLGPLTMRDALARSRNPVAVQLALRVGMDSVIDLARRLGVSTPISPYPASAIGASAVRPLDFVASFAAFDNGGQAVEPHLIRRVEDAAGRAVATPAVPAPRPVLDPQAAFIVLDMMRDVVERGTATSVRRSLPARVPAAGKTGTPNDNTDVWFVGMTPDVVAGVWLGFDRPKTITPGAAGGSLAAPIWGEMMARWYGADRAVGQWTPPEGLVIAELDRETGQLAADTTPPERRYTEYFIPGTEPAAIRPNPWRIFTAGPIVP
ncbi:MAG: PBP1A family penicillin-binding protein [Gemmatimonadaceae bacterium]